MGFPGSGDVAIEGRIGLKCNMNMAKWSSLSEKDQLNVFKKFAKGLPAPSNQVQSTTGLYNVTNPSRAKKKPHQTDSVKKNRTRTIKPTARQPTPATKRKNSSGEFNSLDLMNDALQGLGVLKKKQKK